MNDHPCTYTPTHTCTLAPGLSDTLGAGNKVLHPVPFLRHVVPPYRTLDPSLLGLSCDQKQEHQPQLQRLWAQTRHPIISHPQTMPTKDKCSFCMRSPHSAAPRRSELSLLFWVNQVNQDKPLPLSRPPFYSNRRNTISKGSFPLHRPHSCAD